MNSSEEKNISQFPMVPQCRLQQAASNRMTGTAYIVLCFVQENGHKNVSNEHNIYNQPPAQALEAESPIITKVAIVSVVSPHHAPISMQIATLHLWPHR